MTRTADVVVIGGGANGTSTAFHLALLGVRNVVLLERRELAAGATGKSGALVRMHYTNEPESRLAFESLKVFRNFGEIGGGECGFDGVGFVQLVGHGHEAALRRNVERQRALGAGLRLCRSLGHVLRVRRGRAPARRRHRDRRRGPARATSKVVIAAGDAAADLARSRLPADAAPHPGRDLPLAVRLHAAPPGRD